MRNTVYGSPLPFMRFSRCSSIAGFPCLPSVPSTIPNDFAPLARFTMSRRTLLISPCAYSSLVRTLAYGSYLNAGTVGLAIMIASRWNRPSATKTMASLRSTSTGAVHPSTSPGDRGFDCGTSRLGYPVVESISRTSWTADANCMVPANAMSDPASKLCLTHSTRCATSNLMSTNT